MFGSSKKNSMICIDVGYRNIKVVEVSILKNNEIEIENFGIVSTPQGVIKNGAISDVAVVLKVVREIIRQKQMKAKSSKIIMSGTNIITRILMIDKVEGEEYDETVKKSLLQFLPVNLDEYRVDYKILQVIRERGTEKFRVFVTAVPTDILKSYIEVLYGLELKPLSVDIPANSIAKFFNREITISQDDHFIDSQYKRSDSSAFAVLDFGSETTIVNFIKDKVLEFNKVILAGSSNIDEHIARTMNVPVDEAERIKKIFGLIPPVDEKDEQHALAHRAIRAYVDRLVNQVVKCFEFYLERLYGTQISRIYVIGGGSQLPGLHNYLSSVFKLPVYPVNLLDLQGVQVKATLEKDKLIYLINSIGISL